MSLNVAILVIGVVVVFNLGVLMGVLMEASYHHRLPWRRSPSGSRD